MKSLFKEVLADKPLAEKLRPTNLNKLFGQEHLLSNNACIKQMIATGKMQNIILSGPPGCGKTTLAKIIANNSKAHIEFLSAVASGTAELKQIFADACKRKETGLRTILIVDEIHHFNRTQQDLFLPYLEDGSVTLIAATTENPSFELCSALLSRSIVLVLKTLDHEALKNIVNRAEAVYQKKLPLNEDQLEQLYSIAAGDGRYLLNICETLFNIDHDSTSEPLDLIASLIPRAAIYDKSREQHHNLTSALHKSIRGSDANASLYWLQRMLNAGENPHYILRRLIRIASEDIGLADPNALVQVMSAKDAYDFLGSPEGELAIIQATLYLATAAKSNAIYLASKAAAADAKKYHSLTPPSEILNAPTSFMKSQGYGVGYIYDHDTAACFSGQNYFPKAMTPTSYYHPTGFAPE